MYYTRSIKRILFWAVLLPVVGMLVVAFFASPQLLETQFDPQAYACADGEVLTLVADTPRLKCISLTIATADTTAAVKACAEGEVAKGFLGNKLICALLAVSGIDLSKIVANYSACEEGDEIVYNSASKPACVKRVLKESGTVISSGAWFGFSTSLLNESVLAVGAPNDDGKKGSVYICNFSADSWVCNKKLSDGVAGLTLANNMQFGSAVSLHETNTEVACTETEKKIENLCDSQDKRKVRNIAVGAQNGAGRGPGAVYVCNDRNGSGSWSCGTPIDGAGEPLDYFGSRAVLWLDDETIAVGSQRLNSGEGGIFVCEDNSGWSCTQELPHNGADGLDLTPGDRFGNSIAQLDTNTFAIGAWEDSTGGGAKGAVYICSNANDTWSCSTKIADGNGVALQNSERFGTDVATIDEKTIAVGAWEYGAGSIGAVYTCEEDTSNNWSCRIAISSESSGLTRPGFVIGRLGSGVSVVSFDTCKDTRLCTKGENIEKMIAVGAPNSDSGRGVAYTCRTTDDVWICEHKIVNKTVNLRCPAGQIINGERDADGNVVCGAKP